MIDFLCGQLVEVRENGLVVQVGGIGYAVFCPDPAFFSPLSGEVRLYTHLHVREDEWQLYGFATDRQRRLFRHLLEVGGIGPKTAMAIVGAGAERVVRSVLVEDLSFLIRLPGVGKKTAQRLVLELKEKLSAWPEEEKTGSRPLAMPEVPLASDKHSPLHEAMEALMTLGYREEEAKRLLHSVKDAEQMSLEELIKAALKAVPD